MRQPVTAQEQQTDTQKQGDKTMVEVQNLQKRYQQKTVVKNISFSVQAGEIFGVLGPNGAGKTTTLEMIEGIRQPDGGTALLAGLDIRKKKRAIQRLIGVQLQATALFPELNVLETLRFFRSIYPRGLDPERLLLDVHLAEKARAHPQDLSGGQKQRLALALALVNDPQILFLDEPTAALDPQSRHMLWEIVLKLRDNGKTILLTTHFMDEAQLLCDRIAIMDDGEIIALDTPAGLIGSLGALATIDCRLEERVQPEDLASLPGVIKTRHSGDRFMLYTDTMQSTLEALLAYANTQTIALTDLQVRNPTLEDVFLELTGHALRPE
ncbi:MAG TPA: ABC transporter ATP-binding protein [Ktedonobacteraceae bacterium]|nr:ABC transporter ATP-binding protein [Ktedonobacteraceae bacterium]